MKTFIYILCCLLPLLLFIMIIASYYEPEHLPFLCGMAAGNVILLILCLTLMKGKG